MELNNKQQMTNDELSHKNYLETLVNSYLMYENTRLEVLDKYFTCLEEKSTHKTTKKEVLKTVEMLTNEEIDVMSKYIENGGTLEEFRTLLIEKIKE